MPTIPGLQSSHSASGQAACTQGAAGKLQGACFPLAVVCSSSLVLCQVVVLFHLYADLVQENSNKFSSNMQQLQDSVAKYVAAIDQQVRHA